MEFDTTPGFTDLVNELLYVCNPHALYTLFAENAVSDFIGFRTVSGVVVLHGQTIATPTTTDDTMIKARFYRWVTTFRSSVINVKTYTNNIDPVTHELIVEIRGYAVNYIDGKIAFHKAPGVGMRETLSTDPHTGYRTTPPQNYFFP